MIGPGNAVIKTWYLSELPLWRTQSSALLLWFLLGTCQGGVGRGLLFEEFHLGARNVNSQHRTQPDPELSNLYPCFSIPICLCSWGPNSEAVSAADLSANQQIKGCAKSFLNTNCGMAPGGLLILASAMHRTACSWHWRGGGKCPLGPPQRSASVWVPGAKHMLVPA